MRGRNWFEFVTLLGPGGIGKTTIASAVGRAVAEEFAHRQRPELLLIDGEAVVLGVDGISDFEALCSRKQQR